MQGIIVEIPDHPKTGHKRKVEVIGLGINFNNEVIGLETACTYYENVNGAYGEPVSEPVPIVLHKTLVALTKGERVVFVTKDTSEAVVKKTRLVEEPVESEGEPTTITVAQDYWALEKVTPEVEVPAENVIELFFHLDGILKTSPVILAQLMAKFVLDEVWYGTYDKQK